jgi:cysteine synthase A
MRPGGTPVFRLPSLRGFSDVEVWAKLEGCNPSGSSKDRPAHAILTAAISAGDVHPGITLLESTSGNMAIALAQLARNLGLQIRCVTDDRTTSRNERIMRTLGVKVDSLATTTVRPVQERIEHLEELMKKDPSLYWTRQYSSPDNPASYHAVIDELAEQLGEYDSLLVPVSTGGAATGMRQALVRRGSTAHLLMVDARGSAATRLCAPARRLISGFGSSRPSDFIPAPDPSHTMLVSEGEAVAACVELSRRGFLAGGSSGATVAAAHVYLQKAERRPRRLVLYFPDRGERYLDTLHAEWWRADHAFRLRGRPRFFE